jgi:hypothetical protein
LWIIIFFLAYVFEGFCEVFAAITGLSDLQKPSKT